MKVWRNKKMKKIFTENDDYFKWINKNKEKIKIINFKIKDDIIIIYEEKKG